MRCSDILGSRVVVGGAVEGIVAAGVEVSSYPAVMVLALAGVEAASFLVRGEGPTVMVDTGRGPDKQEPRDKVFGLLMEDMSANGIAVGDIDMVLITHLHADHVGWNFVREGDGYRLTFPNARYWIPRDACREL